MRKHYDTEASRAAFVAADAEAERQLVELPGDEDDRRFRAAQRRMAPAKIALRVNLLEALNEGEDPEMTISAFAVLAAVILFNAIDETGMERGEALDVFATALVESFGNMTNAQEDGSTESGVFTVSDPVLSAAGNA